MDFCEKKNRGFTIIELMVSIFVTLIALGTFFKLYTSSIKSERSTNLRTSVALIGDQIAETISGPVRLIGLNNDFTDFTNGTVLINTDGGSGADTINFRFFSPFGGPITKLQSDATGLAPDCSFEILGSTSFHTGINKIQLMSKNGIYEANISIDSSSIYSNIIPGTGIVDQNGVAFSGDCNTSFPAGTLVTGLNNQYLLTYVNGGANTIVRFQNVTTGEDILNFNNNADSVYKVPFFVLQFQREYDDSGTLRREWVSEINTATEPGSVQEIKAIRFGFVLLSNRERVKKQDSGAGMGTTINYCPFENLCYAHNDINKSAYVFRRLIHVKNFDFLQRNSSIIY